MRNSPNESGQAPCGMWNGTEGTRGRQPEFWGQGLMNRRGIQDTGCRMRLLRNAKFLDKGGKWQQKGDGMRPLVSGKLLFYVLFCRPSRFSPHRRFHRATYNPLSGYAMRSHCLQAFWSYAASARYKALKSLPQIAIIAYRKMHQDLFVPVA